MKLAHLENRITFALFLAIILMQNTIAEHYMGVNPDISSFPTVYPSWVPMGFEKILHWHGYTIYPEPGQFIDWYLNENGHAGSSHITDTYNAVNPAFIEWENVSTADIRFVYKGTTPNTWSGLDNKNVHYWAPEGDPAYGELPLSSYLALTAVTYNNITGDLIDADVIYNDRNYNWGLSDNAPTWYDIRATATHENGHLIGIHHSENQESAMWYEYDGESQRYIQFDDEVAVSFLYGGNLIDSEVWTGNLEYYYGGYQHYQEDFFVPWSLYVTDGVDLTIEPGTTVRIKGQYTSITTVPGSYIDAAGYPDEKIILTSETDSPATSWNLIHLGGDNNYFGDCIFKYARWPLYFRDTENNTVIGCTIQNNQYYGIRVYNGTVTVEDTDIQNNGQYGLYLQSNADVSLDETTISSNSRHGIYAYSSSYLEANNSLICYNGTSGSSYYGIYNKSTATLALATNTNNVYSSGYNTIRNNYSHGVFADYSSPAVKFIGNCILNNSGYEIYNVAGNPAINAEDSWWGVSNPSSSLNQGSVNIIDPLPSAPGWLQKKSGSNLEMTITTLIADYKNRHNSGENDATISEDLIALYGNCRSIFRTATKQEKDDFYVLLSEVAGQNKGNSNGILALRYMLSWSLLNNNLAGAISLCKQILSNEELLPGKENRIIYSDVLSELVFIYCGLGDIESAQKYALEFQQKYGDTEMQYLMDLEIEETKRLMKNGTHQSNQSESDFFKDQNTDSESDAELATNYPNPFNPSTTIQYEMEAPGAVTIIIYNILGKKCAICRRFMRHLANFKFSGTERMSKALMFHQGFITM